MGYLTTAFVFTAEPSFAAMAAALPGTSARGYRHVSRPVWLLDLWEKPWRGAHYPFQDRLAASEAAKAPDTNTDANANANANASTSAFVHELDELLVALPLPFDLLVAEECRLILDLSRHAGVPTFFFVGDDDLADAAYLAEAGRLDRFRGRLGRLIVSHERGSSEIIPTAFDGLDYDDPDDAEKVVAAVRRAVPWPLAPTRTYDEGQPLHESARALWPPEAGDPVETLGIGTWNPAENLDRDFRIVFEENP